METPRKYSTGSKASKLRVRLAQRGRMAEVKRMRSVPASPAARSRSLTERVNDFDTAGFGI